MALELGLGLGLGPDLLFMLVLMLVLVLVLIVLVILLVCVLILLLMLMLLLIEQKLKDLSIAAERTLHRTKNLLVLEEQRVDTLQAALDHNVDQATDHM